MIRNLLVLVCIALLLGCSTQKSTTLRVGYNNWPGYEVIWLADVLGYFKAQNLTVEHLQFVSLGDARRAYERGQLDAVGVTAIELIQIANHARYPAQAALVLDVSHGADQVIADKSIRLDASSIIGKRFAIEPETVSVQLAGLMMKHLGVNWTDVQWVSMSPPEMVEAMQQSRIDVAATYAPFTQQMIANTDGHAAVLFTSQQIPNTIVDMLAINVAHREAHAQEWQRFAIAVGQAMDFLHDKPADAIAIMAAHAGLSVESFKDTLLGLEIPKLSDQAHLLMPNGSVEQGVTATQDMMKRLGVESRSLVLPTSLITDKVVPK
jgi:NitT/TauT family transport system substrate-binding protein